MAQDAPTPTNPLGGKVHGESTRRWTGYSAYVRICPHCAWENPEGARFCVSCGYDVSQVTLQPSTSVSAGISALAKRLEQERRVDSRRRHLDVRGGEGLFAGGLAIILITLAVNPDPIIAIPVWLVSVLLIVIGIWQLRANPSSLRAIGMVLGISASLLLGFVGVRAFQASQQPDPSPPLLDMGTPPPPVTTTATPTGDRLIGEVPMSGGNAQHDGIMPGPAPGSDAMMLWQYDTGGEVHAAATLSDGVLYLMSKSGELVAIDAVSGTHLWAVPVTGYVTRVSPAVADGIVYAGGGFSFGAWDAATGEQQWLVPLQYVGQSSPVLTDDLVIVTSQERWTYALDRETGETVWRIPTEGIVFGAPAVSEGMAFHATDEGVVYRVDVETGRVTWRQRVAGAVFASPVVSSGMVLVTTQAGELSALDAASGAVRWTTLHGSSNSPATNGEIVVVADADGGIYGLDVGTGEQRWLYPTGKANLTAPAISGDTVFVGANTTLLALDLTTGSASWYYLAGDQIDTTPIVAGGRVFFGSRDGFLTSIGSGD